jgi:ABC-type branched-subunit amino acid transport system substrate-binding protein
MRRNHAILGLVAALSCTAALSACGSSDSTSTSSTASGTTAGSGAAATGKIDSSKPPVTLQLNTLKIQAVDLLTPYGAGANAAADVINAQGGIGGRKVEIATCNTMYQPATVATCAHKAVSAKATATFGCDPTWAIGGLPITSKAEIPSFNCPTAAGDYTNPWNVGLTGGSGTNHAIAEYLCTQSDIKKVAAFVQDIPLSHQQTPPSMTPVLTACGKTITYYYYPITGADLTPDVTKVAATKPDFVLTQAGGPIAVQVFKLFEQAGIPATKLGGSVNAFAYDAVLKPSGSAADGLRGGVEVQSWGDTGNPDVAAYLKAMEGSGVDPQDGNPETAYMVVMAIYTAAKKIGFDKFDSASLAKYMTTANNVSLPLNRDILNPGPADSPSIKQPYSQMVQWKDGKLQILTQGNNLGWFKGF